MPSIFDRALFKTPSWSIHDQSESFKGTIPIGKNIPVYYQELYAGDEIDINMAQLTRFLPMSAPVMHRFSIDFIPAFIPFRLLDDAGWWQSEDFFNDATPDDQRPAIPMVSPLQIYYGIDKILGSVWDYLRYPTFTWILQRFMQDKYPIANANTTKYFRDLFDLNNVSASSFTVTIDDNPEILASVYMMARYYVIEYPNADWTPYYSDGNVIDSSKFWDILYAVSGLKQDQAVTKYMNYLHLQLVKAYIGVVFEDVTATKSLSLIPWLCYRKLMDDWFKNTNIQDVDSIENGVLSILDGLNEGLYFKEYSLIPDFLYDGLYSGDCDRALWQSDYFTSAFNNPQAGDTSVPIPVNGTIPDLRTASRIQKALEKTLYAGKRLIDNIFVHRGVRSSDARMHRCEILGHKIFNLKVDDVLQTSQSDINSSLADFAGYGAVAGGDHLCHYRAEEGGLIMVICRVRPRLEYMEVTPRLLLKKDFYDFENPDYDNVGMQPVLINEIQYQGFGMSRVFGYQRRYAEYMTASDHIHADFKSNMDYWHAARMIDTQPALNEEFITMNPDIDGYNRIFAVPGNERPVSTYIRFDVKSSRPLSRYVHFSF